MRQYPDWYLDETLMGQFLECGGNSKSRQERMEQAIEAYLKRKPIGENKDIGYLNLEAPIGAERSLWHFRTPKLKFLPTVFGHKGSVEVVDPKSFEAQTIDLERLSKDSFLELALNKLVLQSTPLT